MSEDGRCTMGPIDEDGVYLKDNEVSPLDQDVPAGAAPARRAGRRSVARGYGVVAVRVKISVLP